MKCLSICREDYTLVTTRLEFESMGLPFNASRSLMPLTRFLVALNGSRSCQVSSLSNLHFYKPPRICQTSWHCRSPSVSWFVGTGKYCFFGPLTAKMAGPAFFKSSGGCSSAACERTAIGKVANLYKFRPMRVDAESEIKRSGDRKYQTGGMFKMENDPREYPNLTCLLLVRPVWMNCQFTMFWSDMKFSRNSSSHQINTKTIRQFKNADQSVRDYRPCKWADAVEITDFGRGKARKTERYMMFSQRSGEQPRSCSGTWRLKIS